VERVHVAQPPAARYLRSLFRHRGLLTTGRAVTTIGPQPRRRFREGQHLWGLRRAENGQERASHLTVRGLLLGCVVCGLFGLAGAYWCFYLMSSSMFSDYHTAGARFAVLVLALVFNAGFVFVWRRLRLSVGELRFITAMTLTSYRIPY